MAYLYKGLEIITPFQVSDQRTVFTNESLNMKRRTIELDGQRFDLSFTVRPSHDAGALMVAHMAGFHVTDTMIMPQIPGIEEARSYNGVAEASVLATAGTSIVTIASVSGHGTGKVIPNGYFIKFEGHSKIYMVTEQVTLNNTNNKILNIYPKLKNDVEANEQIKLGDEVIYRYERDMKTVRGMSFSNGVLTNPGSINLVEKV